MIVVMILIGLTNVFIVGCMQVAYRRAGKYKNSMIIGVTLKEEQYEEREVQQIVAAYKSAFSKVLIAAYITGVLVMLPMEWYMSIWLILYMIWIFGIIIVIQWIYIKYHKKLYALKKSKGWICGNVAKEITIDTKLSIAKSKMAVSPWYFLPSVIIVCLPLLSSKFRIYLSEDIEVAAIILGTIVLVKAAYLLLYYLFAKRRSVVYSQNTEVNIACNRVTKRGFSILFIMASTVDSISFLVLFWDQISLGYISNISVILFVVIQMGIVAGLIVALCQIRKKRDEIRKADDTVCMVDEDEYWERGFYCNPYDNRLLVEGRDNSMHMEFNMAKKSAWVITGTIILGTVGLLIWIFVITLRLDFVETKYIVEDNLQIAAPSYSLTVEFEDIISIKLIEELPEVKMSKDNGAATDQYSIGRFRIRNQGRCWLYVYHGYSPIVEVKTAEATIYFNSKTEGVAEECYRQLQEKTGLKTEKVGAVYEDKDLWLN